jgi:hypothetical protein
MVVSLANIIYLKSNGLARTYGVNEVWASPEYAQLQQWVKKYRHLLFWLSQLGWLPAFWHACLAWVLFEFLVRKRSVNQPL